jgi:fluoroacetyl-CoA thioesterase
LELETGLAATVEQTVTEAMTADALGSGDVPVLGTPAVLALAERAAVQAVAGRLEAGHTSVGSWVELSHLAPTPVGATVTATARLVKVSGRDLTFEVSVHDRAGEVARVRHRRALVRRDQFTKTAQARKGSADGAF